jgi:hypothetical protein
MVVYANLGLFEQDSHLSAELRLDHKDVGGKLTRILAGN